MTEKLKSRYVLEKSLWELSGKIQKTEEALKQAKWNLRSKNAELVEYESGLKGLLDRFTGKRQEKTEAFAREIRRAEENLQSLTRELERMREGLKEYQEISEVIPDLDTLREWALSDEEGRLQWANLEKNLCTEMLLKAIAETDAALEDYRSQLRGERRGQMASALEVHEIGTAHIAPAKRCAELMERMQLPLEILGKSLEIPGYFRNPAGFIVSAAAPHNRLDLVSKALDQVVAVRKQLEMHR